MPLPREIIENSKGFKVFSQSQKNTRRGFAAPRKLEIPRRASPVFHGAEPRSCSLCPADYTQALSLGPSGVWPARGSGAENQVADPLGQGQRLKPQTPKLGRQSSTAKVPARTDLGRLARRLVRGAGMPGLLRIYWGRIVRVVSQKHLCKDGIRGLAAEIRSGSTSGTPSKH